MEAPDTAAKGVLERTIAVRLDCDLLDALEAEARRNERSVSASVRYHLRRALGMAA